MHCTIYKSQKLTDAYVYLAQRDQFALLPAPLRDRLGPLTVVTTLTLHPGRPLAFADNHRVLRQLLLTGFYLQLPPSDPNQRP